MDDDRRCLGRRIVSDLAQDLKPIVIWHHEIQEDSIRLPVQSYANGLTAVTGLEDSEAESSQSISQKIAGHFVVFGQENCFRVMPLNQFANGVHQGKGRNRLGKKRNSP